MLVCQRLKAIRNARGMSQAEVAAQLSISREALCMYETGRRQPSNELLGTLARFYNVSMDYLLGVSDIPDSFADLSGKALYISRALSRLDPETLDYLARFTEQSVASQSHRRHRLRAAESSAHYGSEGSRDQPDTRAVTSDAGPSDRSDS